MKENLSDKKNELIDLVEDTITGLGGTDASYSELLHFLVKMHALSRPKRLMIGQLLFFKYLPTNERFIKAKKYYDIYPLILITEVHRGGFEGINLHYINPKIRATLFNNIMENLVVIRGGETRTNRIKINYHILSRFSMFRYFRPCYRQYKWQGLRKPPIAIPFQLWQTVEELDLGLFRHANKSKIYLESWKKIRKSLSGKRK